MGFMRNPRLAIAAAGVIIVAGIALFLLVLPDSPPVERANSNPLGPPSVKQDNGANVGVTPDRNSNDTPSNVAGDTSTKTPPAGGVDSPERDGAPVADDIEELDIGKLLDGIESNPDRERERREIGVVGGRVFDLDTGYGIPNIRLVIHGIPRGATERVEVSREVFTGDDGRFAAELQYGLWRVRVYAYGFCANARFSVSRTRNGRVDIPVRSAMTENSIAGTVYDSETREPVEGARLVFETAGGERARGTERVTDASGRYFMESPEGDDGLMLAVRCTGFKPNFIRLSLARREPGPLIRDVLLQPGESTILSGRVLDATTGRRVSGARIIAKERGGSRAGTATSDISGAYEMEISVGSYVLYVWSEGYAGYGQNWPGSDSRGPVSPWEWPGFPPVRIEPGENAFDVTLLPRDCAVTGVVLDADTGKPLSGAGVTSAYAANGGWKRAVADSDGLFSGPACAGRICFIASFEGYASAASDIYEAAPGGSIEVKIALRKNRPRDAVLCGRVLSPVSGKPAAWTCVCCKLLPSGDFERDRAIHDPANLYYAKAGPTDGFYEIELRAGTYAVSLRENLDDAVIVSIGPGGEATQDFLFEPDPRRTFRIFVTCTDAATGEPVVEFTAFAFSCRKLVAKTDFKPLPPVPHGRRNHFPVDKPSLRVPPGKFYVVASNIEKSLYTDGCVEIAAVEDGEIEIKLLLYPRNRVSR